MVLCCLVTALGQLMRLDVVYTVMDLGMATGPGHTSTASETP